MLAIKLFRVLVCALVLGACAREKSMGTGRGYYDPVRDPDSALTVSGIWTRPTALAAGEHDAHGGGKIAGPNPNAAIYLTIKNTGPADTLTGAAGDVARSFELHESQNINGVMRMQPLPGGIDVPERATVKLEPGGKHIMLQGVAREFGEGEYFEITLTFKSGRVIRPEVLVQSP
jgi:periplasmic copper chaperone A